jgi:hypothetical protein
VCHFKKELALNLVACQIDFSMNRILDILIQQNDDLQEALSDALNNRDAWKECAEAFFLCAGKDKAASWDQFEKAATLYQSLKGGIVKQ